MENELIPYGEPKVAEVQLVYKTKTKPADRPQINGTQTAYRLLYNTWDKNKLELQEQFRVMLLNRSLRVLGFYDAASGGTWEVTVDARLIFAAALKCNASEIILAHNHPSGDALPSAEDKALTKRLVLCGKLLKITVLDHIIITRDNYYSFADNKLIIN